MCSKKQHAGRLCLFWAVKNERVIDDFSSLDTDLVTKYAKHKNPINSQTNNPSQINTWYLVKTCFL